MVAHADTGPSKLTVLTRGLALACPACGQGKLLRGYLKQVDRCACCGTEFGHLRADDAPPWMTVMIAGHIVVPLALTVEQSYSPALWLQVTAWPLVAIGLCLALLPRCKGVVLGLLWSTKAAEADTRA